MKNTMSDAVIKITDDGFETEVLNSDKPTLVDFWAEWCGPCRALTPVINEIEEKGCNSMLYMPFGKFFKALNTGPRKCAIGRH